MKWIVDTPPWKNGAGAIYLKLARNRDRANGLTGTIGLYVFRLSPMERKGSALDMSCAQSTYSSYCFYCFIGALSGAQKSNIPYWRIMGLC